MRYSVESIVKHLISENNHNMNIAFPAVVVNVDNLKDGLIDVQPIVNYSNPATEESVEYPVLYDIRVLFPSNQNSTICFPVAQGDFVEICVQSVDIQSFVNGKTEQHDTYMSAHGNLSNVVAKVGFTPFQDSCFNASNYREDFDMRDLNIVHNKNTENEVSIKCQSNGEILLKSPVKVTIDSKQVDFVSNKIDTANATIKSDGDFILKGKSLLEFMNIHTHIGNQGSPTSPPQGF